MAAADPSSTTGTIAAQPNNPTQQGIRGVVRDLLDAARGSANNLRSTLNSMGKPPEEDSACPPPYTATLDGELSELSETLREVVVFSSELAQMVGGSE